MAVGHIQHAPGQPILPLQTFDALALGALAITTAKILIAGVATVPATDPSSTQSRGATKANGSDQLDCAPTGPEGADIVFPVIAKQLPYRMFGR